MSVYKQKRLLCYLLGSREHCEGNGNEAGQKLRTSRLADVNNIEHVVVKDLERISLLITDVHQYVKTNTKYNIYELVREESVAFDLRAVTLCTVPARP